MAWTLYHAPVLEAPYAHVAHTARSVPGVHTLFREATDRLTVRLVRSQRQRRRIRIGSVAPVFDVSSFTVKGQYFSHVPYEPGATAAVLGFLHPGGVFVDIGANTGYFTILAALRVGPRGHVVAFEPNPVVARRLKDQVQENAVGDRVTVGGVAIADRGLPLGNAAQQGLPAGRELRDARTQIRHGSLRGNGELPVGGDLTPEADQLASVLGLGRFEETPFEPGAQRLGMFESVVERCDLLAGRCQLFVEKPLPASMVGLPRGCLRHERAGPMGFCAGFVHPCAHLLHPAFEEKDTMRVVTGHIRGRVCQLLSVSHDRTTDGIFGVVPALKWNALTIQQEARSSSRRIATARCFEPFRAVARLTD